jgi:molybdopterin synthase sulfur carrier subunit
MPVVWIPSLMQGLTGGKEQVRVEGETIREVINNLEAAYPGVKDRVCEEDRIRPGLAVSVDGVVTNEGMRQKVDPESEIHFVTAISGGR